jgi:peptidoglycan-N-acetylglucosamine deacetylase
MYLIKTPRILKNLFPNYTWNIKTEDKVLYLTFDDGPIPEITPWVLDTLARYNAKATFFCVGDNVKKHPTIFNEVVSQGHSVGNHTFNHLDGWASDNIPYYHNIRNCAHLVKSNLFRPPYGRLTPVQTQFLARHYKIVMWDVLSGDFDQNLSPQAVLDNVLDSAKRGSIIVFHDSQKAAERMQYALPRVLEHFSARGYRFDTLGTVFKQEKWDAQVAVEPRRSWLAAATL